MVLGQGLTSEPAASSGGGSGQMHAMGGLTTTGASDSEPTGGNNSNGNGSSDGSTLETDVSVSGVDSHLDSFFEASNWTREDVMVIAAGIQVATFLALLYVEAQG